MICGNKKNQQGFVALMAVIIISAVLLMMMVTAAGIAFRGRFTVLDYENKKISVGLAESCVRIAQARIAQDNSYAGNEKTALEGGKTCKICPIVGNGPYTVQTRAVYNNAYTNLTVRMTLNGASFTINSWDETPAGGCTLN